MVQHFVQVQRGQAHLAQYASKSIQICPRRSARLDGVPTRRTAARCLGSSPNVSYFEILGVTDSASVEEIKAAFRAKSKLLHPDVNKEPTAARDFMLLRRAYATLTTAELRAEYEAKLGMPSARASDPRFARFERWRREVVPDLRMQLEFWSSGVEGFISSWRLSVDQREQNLARLYAACVVCLRQLLQLRSAKQRDEGESDRALYGGALDGSDGGGSGVAAEGLLRECQEALQAMAAEVEGITSDTGDGTARLDRELEKRYQQVSMRYPAYPDLVWLDVWEETAEQWTTEGRSQVQRCDAAVARWSAKLHELHTKLEELQAGAMEELQGQLAGAGTGRFNEG